MSRFLPRYYRKKPVVIQAMQWDGTVEVATKIIDWILSYEGTARYHEKSNYQMGYEEGTFPAQPAYIGIDTLEGVMMTTKGDYVIKGVQDEFYPCKPGIFEQTYERTS
jgi:hypothetical protein